MTNLEGKPIKKEEDFEGESFLCPNCKTKVGGYYITGCGENDWCYTKDKFCKNCGMKINWEEE